MNSVRIGTRGSQLAMWQSEEVGRLLRKHHPGLKVEIVRIKTQGDIITDVALSKLQGKAFFTKEIEDALLDGRADLAVHSGKDVPTELPDGLLLAGFLARHSPLDALISAKGQTLADLPWGAILGTSSIRRKAFAGHLRPDLKIADLRGNVDTRLGKLDKGLYDAIILAEAGLHRLGMAGRITERLDPKRFLPAVCQGAIALEIRCDDAQMKRFVDPLIDENTTRAVTAERALLRSVEAGCQVPLGALATLRGNRLLMSASIVAPDGSLRVDGSLEGDANDPEGLGIKLALDLRARGGEEILRKVRLGAADL